MKNSKDKKKAEYKDLPRFSLINNYEDEIKKEYKKSLGRMVGEIASKLNEFVK